MNELAVQFAPLIYKDPIVSTFDSRAAFDQPKEVVRQYHQHAMTYVGIDALRNLEQRLIDGIVQARTPKACLVGNYGYGKTTAAIGLWQGCEQANILAVPPIGYTSLAEIATTVYSWVRTALTPNTAAVAELDDLYAAQLRASRHELARRVSLRSGHTIEQVLDVLTDPVIDSSLTLSQPITNVVLFFEAVTQLVCATGYRGLVIFIDEFQQLLGKAGAEVITELRSFIWGLRTRKITFGVVITMDTNSERVLSDRAGDILHRIKDDELYLDFRQLYNSDFPQLLWERYAQQLQLNGLTFQVVDKPTLTALGQIAERPDLSNGPRTVANVFRSIAAHFVETGKTYTPIQLIDDFISGDVTFDGDASTIASIVTEFGGYSYFKRSEAHLEVLKLLAAFPRGCTPEVASAYGLRHSFDEVTAELRGDIVTLLPEGFALVDLQRVGKPTDRLGVILKKYWMQISDSELDPNENARRFAQHIVPLLFPAAAGQDEQWTTTSGLMMTADNAYTQTFSGRLHDRHPLRRIQVIVTQDEGMQIAANTEIDFCIIFVLGTDAVINSQRFRRTSNTLTLLLRLDQLPTGGLPSELRVVEHNLNPQPGTPAVLLNVIEFIEHEVAQATLTQPEQARVDRVLEQLRRWLLSSVFDEQLLRAADTEAATPGYRGMRDLLFRECERRFPNYRTLITSKVWDANLMLLRKVLAGLSLVERRGINPVEGSKEQLAALFGQRSHAGFESKIRVQYPDLVELTWSGEQGKVRCVSHPMETHILSLLGGKGSERARVAARCRDEGYTVEEIEQLLALLVLRGQIKEDAGYIIKEDTITAAESQRLASKLLKELLALKEMLTIDEGTEELELLTTLVGDDSTDRDLMDSRLIVLVDRMPGLRRRASENLITLLDTQNRNVARLLESLDTSIPGFSAQTAFRNHLEGARKQLEEHAHSMRNTAVRLRSKVQADRNEAIRFAVADIGPYLIAEAPRLWQRDQVLHELEERVQYHLQQVNSLDRWIAWGEKFVRTQYNLTELTARIHDIEPTFQPLLRNLDALEMRVREQLAHYGLTVLDQIDDVERALDAVARECDHHLLVREQAFDHEKAELHDSLTRLTGSIHNLRGKYQGSKHEESYADLYQEAAQTMIRYVRMHRMRVQVILDAMLESDKSKPSRSVSMRDRKALGALTKRLIDVEHFLSGTHFNDRGVRQAFREHLTRTVMALHQDISTLERKLAPHLNLSSTDEDLVLRLTVCEEDISTILDVEGALKALPDGSELAALLRLYRRGIVDFKVRLEIRNSEV